MTDLTAKRFTDETAAREHLETIRWPNGAICPHCGSVDSSSRITGKTAREGLWFCGECRKQFTVTVGTVFERSHIPLHKWLLANHLLCSSKKGMSAHQLHRMLGVTYKTAWFMAHRIREAMKDQNPGPMGGEGQTIEADETYYGPKDRKIGGEAKQGPGGKSKVVSLVERGGRARSFKVERMNTETVREILVTNASRKSALMTDESGLYPSIGSEFASHGRIMHSAKQYGRGEIHTNTIEGFFSIFKRGMRGIYQHCGEQHLQRYLNEFDFRYSNRKIADAERAMTALAGIGGKRLTYRRANQRA